MLELVEKYNFENRKCNGACLPLRSHLTEEQKKELDEKILPEARDVMVEKFGSCNDSEGLFTGIRFADTKSIIERIESVSELKWKGASLQEMAIDALYDCMSADYYYTFEKEW